MAKRLLSANCLSRGLPPRIRRSRTPRPRQKMTAVIELPIRLPREAFVRSVGDLGDQVEDLAGVTPFVVIPGNDFNEGVVQLNTAGGIEDAGAFFATEIG